MASTGRGPKKPVPVEDRCVTNPDSPQYIENPKYLKAVERAYNWALHCEAQFMGPYFGDTDEEREKSIAACMQVASYSKEMALLWAEISKILPQHVAVTEGSDTTSDENSS